MIHDGGLSYEISKDFKIPLRMLYNKAALPRAARVDVHTTLYDSLRVR